MQTWSARNFNAPVRYILLFFYAGPACRALLTSVGPVFPAPDYNKNAGAGKVFCRFKRTIEGRGLRLDVLSTLKWHSSWYSSHMCVWTTTYARMHAYICVYQGCSLRGATQRCGVCINATRRDAIIAVSAAGATRRDTGIDANMQNGCYNIHFRQ